MRILFAALSLFFLFAVNNCGGGDKGGDITFFDVQESSSETGAEVEDDSAQGETGDDVVPGDTEKDFTPEACSNECAPVDAAQCVDNKSFKKCEVKDGCLVWTMPVLCLLDEECLNGKCEKKTLCDPLKKCDPLNAVKCQNDKVLKCSNVQYGGVNCPEWMESETCQLPKKCVNGQCKEEGTGKSCAEIAGCIEQNQCQDQQCLVNCYNQGSPEAQTQFNEFSQCLANKCGAFTQEQPTQYTLCLYENCKDPYEACLGTIPSGDKKCMDVLNCMNGCGNPPQETCVQGCLSSGTYDAQLKLLKIGACIEKNCSNSSNIQQCAQQKCMSEVLACYSS
ncbi:MAG: hypothetical protein FJ088_01280 [Deltaproteobacteria bacterium]|nr:hypothetical protein [Deltaproteobacteria bacterium]